MESIPFQLIINVTNVDDEPPVFRSQDYKNLEKTLFVQEGKPPLFVGEIKAYDSYPDSKPCYKIGKWSFSVHYLIFLKYLSVIATKATPVLK